jgi:galactokinase
MRPFEQIQDSFLSYFNSKPAFLVRAPGRVNLIGEHTDYNEGFVLPMAIDRAVRIALTPRTDHLVRLRSLDFDAEIEFSLDSFSKEEGWPEYVKGVAYFLQEAGFVLQGWDGVMAGDVPVGAGLSSSAAVEMATARAFAITSGFEWDPLRVAKIGQRAENEWIGVKSGIMDQMASAACIEGHALFLDCRSLEIQQVPLPEDVSVVIMDTGTRRGLIDSTYNERRAQCEESARFFGVKALRDVSVEKLQQAEGAKPERLSDVTLRRARHVITENQRVLDAMGEMRRGRVAELGKLLNQSHWSLRDDFEVTNEALNQIVECAQRQGGCHGARMTGAGFGGCAIALVDASKSDMFVRAVIDGYREVSGLEPQLYACRPSQGASFLSL